MSPGKRRHLSHPCACAIPLGSEQVHEISPAHTLAMRPLPTKLSKHTLPPSVCLVPTPVPRPCRLGSCTFGLDCRAAGCPSELGLSNFQPYLKGNRKPYQPSAMSFVPALSPGTSARVWPVPPTGQLLELWVTCHPTPGLGQSSAHQDSHYSRVCHGPKRFWVQVDEGFSPSSAFCCHFIKRYHYGSKSVV